MDTEHRSASDMTGTDAAAGSAPRANDAAPYGAGMGLSIASAITGAASIPIAFWATWALGLILALVAIVLGAIALKRGARKALPIIGIVLGSGCLAAFAVLVGLLIHHVSQIASVLP